MIKAILADDASIMRKAISRFLKDNLDLEVVAETDSYSGLLKLMSDHHPDIVILDLHMPDEGKFTELELKACLNGCPVLAISVWNDGETKSRADALGAYLLLDKTLLAEQLIPAIQECSRK
jgi:DNA-binding NarL/FixJ family response regulator